MEERGHWLSLTATCSGGVIMTYVRDFHMIYVYDICVFSLWLCRCIDWLILVSNSEDHIVAGMHIYVSVCLS